MSLFRPVAPTTGANVLNMPSSPYGMPPNAVRVYDSYDTRQFVPVQNAPPHSIPHTIQHTASDARSPYQQNYGYGAASRQSMYGAPGMRGVAPYDTYMQPNPSLSYTTNPYARP